MWRSIRLLVTMQFPFSLSFTHLYLSIGLVILSGSISISHGHHVKHAPDKTADRASSH